MLVDRSALALASMIRDREVSSVEVVQAHLDRIEARNPMINAVVAIAADARDQAAALDRRLATGEPIGPFHGVPFTAKDIIETADLPTTLGLRALAANRPDTDAGVVRKMREAGAILLGKTNCPPGGSGGDTANELHGRTSNPYDPALTPAGSSGGEAAAIASGMSPCGIGSDSGGSLRMPAHVCGVAALKPTAGAQARRLAASSVARCDDQGMTTPSEADLVHLRRCVELARAALEAGDEPFGSVLVASDGRVLFEDHNHVAGGDHTQHPELAIARWAASNLDPVARAAATVYTSGEHCPMCAAAHGWVGLGRIVYAASSAQLVEWLSALGVPPAPVRALPINDVVPDAVVEGPVDALADEVHELHRRFHAAR